MPIRIRRPPDVVSYIERHPASTRTDVALALGISYWSARYWLERYTELGYLRSERVYTLRGLVRRVLYYPVPRIPEKQLVHSLIVIYSTTESPPPKAYKYRFQAFYDIDTLRDSVTGKIEYDSPLTRREVDACIVDFYERWGWIEGRPPKDTTEPVWVETSEFEFIPKLRGAIIKSISKIEDEEETYWNTLMETVYTIGEEDEMEIQ